MNDNAETGDKNEPDDRPKKHHHHMAPSFCSGNPGAIASWTSTAHVATAPKKPKPPAPPTP